MKKETAYLVFMTVLFSVFLFVSCEEDKAKYTFPHQPHYDEGITCDACHELTDTGNMTMPAFDFCLICHEEQPNVFASCDQCHTSPPTLELGGDRIMSHQALFKNFAPKAWDDVEMDHEKYIELSESDSCLVCHENVKTTRRSTIENLPNMNATMAFHEAHEMSNDCSACHQQINKLTPPESHDRSWDTHHGFAMEFQDQSSCLLCHEQETCTICHQTHPPKNHNNQWRKQTHGIHAAFDRESCLVCHRNDECTTCHIAAAQPVPPAEFHTQEANCLACHAPVGAPRPSNRFLKPMPHRMMMGMTSQKCLSCHLF